MKVKKVKLASTLGALGLTLGVLTACGAPVDKNKQEDKEKRSGGGGAFVPVKGSTSSPAVKGSTGIGSGKGSSGS